MTQQHRQNEEHIPAGPPPRVHRPDALLHWNFLGLSAVVVLLAILLQVRDERSVVVPGLELALPGTCTFRQYFGADCPGCGLTRCFVSMAHGEVQRAWQFNPVGIFLFMVVASQIPFRTWQLWRLRSGLAEIHLGWWGYSVLLFVVAGLLIQWIVRVTMEWL